MEQTLTVKELVEQTIDILNSIPVPLKYYNLIIAPIQSALNNLTACIHAWDEVEQEQKKEKEGDKTNE